MSRSEETRLQFLLRGIDLPRAKLPRDANGLITKPIRLVEHRHLVVEAIAAHHDKLVSLGEQRPTHPKQTNLS